jgi:hypothetical protein
MHPCHYVANVIRIWYHYHEFFATGVNFDEEGIEQNWGERGRFFLIKYLQIFWGTLKVEILRKIRGTFFIFF